MKLNEFVARELGNYMTAVQSAAFCKRLESLLADQNTGQQKEEDRKAAYIERLEEERVELYNKIKELEVEIENNKTRPDSGPVLRPTEDREAGPE